MLQYLRRHWLIMLFILIGVGLGASIGLGGYTFHYAKGSSYLTNDPKACMNCHVMKEQYDGWSRGSHRAVATCNDCHAPQDLIPKYWVKARNGFWHSFYFTTGSFHEPIRIGAKNLEVTEQACRHCHGAVTHAIGETSSGREPLKCTHCHSSVGHLK